MIEAPAVSSPLIRIGNQESAQESVDFYKQRLDELKEIYRESIIITERNYKRTNDFQKRNASLFLAYYQFIKALTSNLDPGEAVYIYPVSGPDPAFQMHADTFALNNDATDSLWGRELLEKSGILGRPDYGNFDDDIIFQKLLSKGKSLDAYDLKNYFDIKREQDKKFIFIMKGFMCIAQQFISSEAERRNFLENLMFHFLQVGDKIIVFEEEDQKVFESIPAIKEYYRLLYRDDGIFEGTKNASIAKGIIKLVSIPNRIAIYEKSKDPEKVKENSGFPLEDNPAAGSKMVKNSEASLDSVTEEEVEAVLEDMNRHFEYNSSYDKQKIRTMALKILKLGIIKGKSFLVVGPSKMDLLPIFLAKLGLKTTIIDIDESSVKYQKMIYEEIGIKGKVVAFTSYTELGDRKFDYVSILGVAHEATFSAELVFGDSGAYESRMKEFLIPIVEHLNLEGGYIFVNTPQYTNSLRYERAVLDSFKRILSTYGNELNTNFILQYDADINNFSLHLGHLQEKRIGKVYKAVNKVSGSINSAGSEKPSSSQEDNPAAGSPRAGQSASSAMEVKTETSLGHRLGTSSPINDRSIADAYELFEKHFAIPRDGSIGSPFEDEPRLIAKLFANGRVSIFDQQDEHPGREMPWLDIWLRQGPDMDKMYLVIAAENKIPEDHLLSQFMPRIIKHAKEAIDFINHKVEEPIDIQFANHLVRGWSTDEFYEFFAKVFNDVGHSVWQNNFKDITGSDVKNWLSDISWAYLNSDVQVKQIGIRLVSKLGVTASPKERYQFLQQWMEALSRENISPIAGRLSYLSLQGNMLQGPTGSPLMQSETQKTPNTASPINRGLGGIDFRSLPIVIQAMSNLRNSLGDSLQFRTVGDTFRQGYNGTLKRKVSPTAVDQELQEIEKLVEAGITPSTQRIKEYVASSCVKGSILQDKDKVILCIADILRSEEETCLATDPTLRDILVVLEASGSSAELSRIFLG